MRVAEPELVILVGFTIAVNPRDGAVERLTVPVKPLNASTVIVAVPESPASTGPIAVELAVTLKSGPCKTVKVTTTE